MKKVTVITANELSKANLETIKKSLIAKYGKDLEFELKIDPAVIGGVKLVIGSKAVDMTIKAKLSQIEKQVMDKI
ncbi:MAG: F0F1 ATP synthase subunit delta [Candidatus Pacebacteria bacterium]|nr:F0F1 ATP synthase subunit delta [Candidatus Paceibacterota bacterium]